MEMWKTAALPMENPFTGYGKGQALSHSLQTGFPQHRIHASLRTLHTTPAAADIHPILSYPTGRKKRKYQKKSGDTANRTNREAVPPFLRGQKCVKIRFFSSVLK